MRCTEVLARHSTSAYDVSLTQLTAIKSIVQIGWQFQQLDVTSRWLSVDNLLHGIQTGTSNVTFMDNEFFHEINSFNHLHFTAETSVSCLGSHLILLCHAKHECL